MKDNPIVDLLDQTKRGLAGLFHINADFVQDWEKGLYFVIYANASRRMQAILGVEREILIIGNNYLDQQARTLGFAQHLIKESRGRLEPHLFFIVHRDARGNAKLKKWGREAGVTIIPIYAGTDALPSGPEFERLLAYELFAQDPFDITGPVASDAQFFGRRTEAQELARKLQNGQIRACFGIRKIGKTSVMHRVLQEIDRNFDSITIFTDCQQDSIFQLRAANLLVSIAATLDGALTSGRTMNELSIIRKEFSLFDASRIFLEVLDRIPKPVILAFDEVDYITPGSPTATHWREDFIEFWRNIRAGYQAATRSRKKLSILISGVSSKWFSVELINGIENAALSFVPEEYLSPLPRGAAVAMIRSVGPVAGLNFEEAAADYIAACCSDMPFWIRKACSFLHMHVDTIGRPITVKRQEVEPIIQSFIRDEGAAMAQVALRHLFRVYPELQIPALKLLNGPVTDVVASTRRVLAKYGVINSSSQISGEMLRAGLMLMEAPADEIEDRQAIQAVESGNALALALGDWAEELQLIGRRRNIVERKLREIVFNFVKFSALNQSDKKPAKQRILDSIPENRRIELANFTIDQISENVYWLELASVIKREWTLFDKLLGDKKLFQDNVMLVNERPDAHAKSVDLADVALYRRALTLTLRSLFVLYRGCWPLFMSVARFELVSGPFSELAHKLLAQ